MKNKGDCTYGLSVAYDSGYKAGYRDALYDIMKRMSNVTQSQKTLTLIEDNTYDLLIEKGIYGT